MRNLDSEPKDFQELGDSDKDMNMFTMTDLRLEKIKEQVHMMISLKRKIQMELLTTYLPSLLLLSISYATTFFAPEYFEASLTVNLTIMLVMTTIFTSKIAELPPTSDMKMLDIWLIFCLIVPFAFAMVQTAIENYRDRSPDIDQTRPEETRPEETRPVSAWTGEEVCFPWELCLLAPTGALYVILYYQRPQCKAQPPPCPLFFTRVFVALPAAGP